MMAMRRGVMFIIMTLMVVVVVVAAAEPLDFAPDTNEEEYGMPGPVEQLFGVPYFTPNVLLQHKLMLANLLMMNDDARNKIPSSYTITPQQYQYDNQNQLPYEDLEQDYIIKRTEATGSVAGNSGSGGQGISGSGSSLSPDSGRKWNKKKGKVVRGRNRMSFSHGF